VAFNTIFKVSNVFFKVLFTNFGRFMFVAVVTGVFGIVLLVTGGASVVRFAMCQWECVVGQLGGFPGGGCVAAETIEAKLPGVEVWFSMALAAFLRRSLKYPFLMTFLALNGVMGAI
jgi:hypothetical protein